MKTMTQVADLLAQALVDTAEHLRWDHASSCSTVDGYRCTCWRKKVDEAIEAYNDASCRPPTHCNNTACLGHDVCSCICEGCLKTRRPSSARLLAVK